MREECVTMVMECGRCTNYLYLYACSSYCRLVEEGRIQEAEAEKHRVEQVTRVAQWQLKSN